MTKIKLADLMDSMSFSSHYGKSVVHLKTGECFYLSPETLEAIDQDEVDCLSLPEEDLKMAKDYLVNPEDYLFLPSQEESHEYQMMQDFVASIEDEKIASGLCIALNGKGAFRRFKDSVILYDIEQEWYKFREESYRQFAFKWCQEHQLVLEA